MAERQGTVKVNLKPGDTAQISKACQAGAEKSAKTMGTYGLKPETLSRMPTGAASYARMLQIERESGADAPKAPARAGTTDYVGQALRALGGVAVGRLAGGQLGGIIGGGAAGGPVGLAVGVAVGAVENIFGKVKEAVAKFSPGTMHRYEMAWDDLYAVIGEKLVPVIKFATEAVRAFADWLNNASRASTVAAERMLLEPAFANVPGGQDLLAEINRQLGGIESSNAKAARPISFTGADDAAKRFYQAAYMSGADPAKQTADGVMSMVGIVGQIGRLLQQWYGQQMGGQGGGGAVGGSPSFLGNLQELIAGAIQQAR